MSLYIYSPVPQYLVLACVSLALAASSLGDGRWHALQLEHNMMEVSLTTVMELSK